MPSGFKVHGVDLDSIFAPRAGATPAANTGFKTTAGQDLADRYRASTGGDRIGYNTGFKVNGTDLKDIFRDLSYVGAPVIITHPSPQTVGAGSSVTFTVVAGGTGPFTYQWVKDTDGNAVAGATSASLTINPVALGDSGSYACWVDNGVGNVRSNYAALTVTSPPVITGDPSGFIGCVGSDVVLSVAATGSGLSYQWRKGGSNILGATASTLTLTNAQTTDSGSYDCVVTNAYGSDTSASATVTIDSVISITGGTVTGGPYTLNIGDVASFTVTATGTNLVYVWKKDGVPTGHTGPSGPSFVCSGDPDEGTYSVEISNGCDSASASTSLTVNP